MYCIIKINHLVILLINFYLSLIIYTFNQFSKLAK